MTAAERRVYDARLQWKAVQEGRNPFGGGPLTPKIAAAVEDNYRRQIANAGQKYLRSDDALTQAEKIVARAGGAGGAGTRPPRTTSPGPDDWQARQEALGPAVARSRVGTLDPGEIVFVERFRAGSAAPLEQRLWWLEKGLRVNGNRLPSYDFRWLEMGGLLVDLKSVSNPTVRVIQNRIWKPMNRAWMKHRFVKENFIIDIGDHHLTDELRSGLAAYNKTNSGRRLSRLFVMSRGRIEEIRLST